MTDKEKIAIAASLGVVESKAFPIANIDDGMSVVVDNTGELNFPTATITFGENNMPTVELKNWGGINAMMIERATYEIHRASHQHRANELHKQNVEKQNIENLKGEQNV